MNRARFFRTVFVRYRAKNDMSIAKELQEMNISLSESGAEMMANYKNIKKRLELALASFRNVRKEDLNELEVSISEDTSNMTDALRFS